MHHPFAGDQHVDGTGSDVSIAVRTNVAEEYSAMARYAIASLLEPLSLRPRWVDSSASDVVPVLYYGPAEDRYPHELQLSYSIRAEEMFLRSRRLDEAAVAWIDWEGESWPALFADERGAPDIIASTFYLLSGWQESRVTPRDRNGRFRFEDSIQARLGFADKPVVDAYREWLAAELATAGIEWARRRWGGSDWAVCPTVDVDYLWKWRKGMIYREVVHHLMLNARKVGVGARVRRFRDFVVDAVTPGDVYRSALARMVDEIRSRDGTATILFKAGAHGPNDVHYSLTGRWLSTFQQTAAADNFELGLHPSYYSNAHGGYLADEVEIFRSSIGEKPTTVRQHFLRYDMPITMKLHESAGFTIDSTLGFAGQEGFRRSTCMPFRLFDVHRNRETSMWEMPLAVMDGALFNRQGYSLDEAVTATSRILDRCRKFGGCAVLLWHNVLWDEMDAPGWGEHFLSTLDSAVEANARISSLSGALREWLPSVA
ncbi:MAG: hypothetical protein HKN37_10060 [Rhodothermales bacterium]|nr:hypothetical protein [Rhodothermales bacterium]